ncbi:Homeobox-containing protein 1 [Takifugu flavidus]|uniref:Homeobox-containing protein 1 n=1 Tax=Takifugu flavidus TaxID=433684 RepID=A0A5C6NLJ4_9TELE|nr:Homeobox-containing protein 1 [Takifugu flavidus]
MFPRSLLLLTNCLSCLLSSSRMSDFSEEPRFTIEQIDLLQRLRRTGMTKQEILHALDTLDRLDREHGDKFGHRTSSSSSSLSYGAGGANNTSASNATTSLNSTTSASAAATSSASCNGNNSSEGNAADHLAAPAASSTTSKISTATQTQFGSGGLSPSPGNNYDTSPPPGPPPPSAILPSPVSLVALSQNGRDSLAATPNGKLSPPRYPVNSSAAARAFGFEAAEEDLDIDDKVEELMRRDSSMVKEEIKAFLGNRRISQAVVAQVTGISQSRISHWLLQHGSDLSEQKKRAFYRWYTLEKTTPGSWSGCSFQPGEDVVRWRLTVTQHPPVSRANKRLSAASPTSVQLSPSSFLLSSELEAVPTRCCWLMVAAQSSAPPSGAQSVAQPHTGTVNARQQPPPRPPEASLVLCGMFLDGVLPAAAISVQSGSVQLGSALHTGLHHRCRGNPLLLQPTGRRAQGATLNMRPAPLPMEEMEWRQTPPPIATAPGTFRLRRGSRFTWRKECLAVMESYFNDNQYPDEAKREEIANACNAVIQKPGKKLSDLERVTSLKVYNWFANRRKEIKRRANIEATILESHGIDVQSPGGHSNSDDIDGNDFSEQACDLPYFDKRPLSRPFGLYRLEPTSPTQDDSAVHSEHQDPISLAVEMAAVNHSILALSRTGGVPNDIKTESLEDE